MKNNVLIAIIDNANIDEEAKKALFKSIKEQNEISEQKFEDREPINIKTYMKNIGKLKGILNNGPRLLFELIKNSTKRGEIFLSKPLKDKIIKKLKISEKTYTAKKTVLIKAGMIKKISYGVYKANPNYFGRGGWHRISEQRKSWIRIDIDEKGREELTTSMQDLKSGNIHNMEDY